MSAIDHWSVTPLIVFLLSSGRVIAGLGADALLVLHALMVLEQPFIDHDATLKCLLPRGA